MSETKDEYAFDMMSAAPATSWQHELESLAQIVSGKKVSVLTGAGVSTDSGIPDYRGQGVLRRNPMSIDQFVSDENYRKRYWAGSHQGWSTFASAEPNLGHRALAALEAAGIVSGIVTQNVDGLHRRAGSMHVIDLHGSLDRVVCMECGQRYDRGALATRLSRENPWLDVAEEATLAPDGDADVSDFAELRVPICDVCSGLVKPDVVFFGEVVPFRVYQSAASIVRKSDVLLVAGSSLAVNSGFRLVDVARRSRIPVVIINRGETKADGLAHLRIDAGVSDVLTDLARRLGVHDILEDIE